MANYSDVPIINIPDDILKAIGKVSITWGTLESTMDLAILKLAGLDDRASHGFIVTAHMSFPMKMDVIGALVHQLLPEFPHLEAFKNVKPLLKKAQEGRNAVSHGAIGGEKDGRVMKHRATARGKLVFGKDEITLAGLEQTVLDIHRAMRALWMMIINA